MLIAEQTPRVVTIGQIGSVYLTDQSPNSRKCISSHFGAIPTTCSTVDLLRWIVLLPIVFFANSFFGVLFGLGKASLFEQSIPIVIEFISAAAGSWVGVLTAYHLAPNRKWEIARAIALLLGVKLWILSLGWASPWSHRIYSAAVSVAIAASPWFAHLIIVIRQPKKQPLTEEPKEEPLPQLAKSSTLTDERHNLSSPSSESEALRWIMLLPITLIIYYISLTIAFAPAFAPSVFQDIHGEQAWRYIAISFVITGWVVVLSSAWIAPTRKRKAAFASYLAFLFLSLPLSGRALVARGLDTSTIMLGIWLIITVAVAPAFWSIERIWRASILSIEREQQKR